MKRRHARTADTQGYTTRRDRQTPMDEAELSSLIQRKIDQSLNSDEGSLSTTRSRVLDSYYGKSYGTERKGKSSVVTREVLEAVEWTLPDLMEAFTGRPETVEFLPEGPEDEDAADLETKAVNHYLRKNMTGRFMPIYNWVKDTLLQPVGYLKVYPKETQSKEFERYKGLHEADLRDLQSDPDLQITSIDAYDEDIELPAEAPPPPGAIVIDPITREPLPIPLLPPGPGPIDPNMAQNGAPPASVSGVAPGPMQPLGLPSGPAPGQPPMPGPGSGPGPMDPTPPPQGPPSQALVVRVTTYDVEALRKTEKTEIVFEPVPGEEILVDKNTTEVDLDTAKCVIHRTEKTYTELVQLGYDPDLIEEAGGGDNGSALSGERANRLFRDGENPAFNAADAPGTDTFWLSECYLYVDYDGDGEAEFRRVVLLNKTILENELCDYMPIIAMCCMPVSHKHAGLSYGELVYDLQRIQSQLHRQLLDNMYAINVRKRYVHDELLLPDGQTQDAMRHAIAEWIPVAQPPAQGIMFEPTTNIIGDVMQAIGTVKEMGKIRTGVSPDMNVDPNVLQQSTAAAFNQAQSGAHKRQTLLIRVLAETGFRKLGVKLHQLLRQYIDHELRFMLKKQWITVNPSEWRRRTDVAVNVGLGHAGKEQQIQSLMAVLAEQKEQLGTGLASPKHIYKTLARITEAAGLSPTASYFIDPESPEYVPPQPPPPDPMMQAQAEAYAAQAEDLRAKAQTHTLTAQQKMLEAKNKSEIEIVKAQAAAEKAEQDALIAVKKAELEEARIKLDHYKLQLERARLEAEVQKMTAETDAADARTVQSLAQAQKAQAEAAKVRSQSEVIAQDTAGRVSEFIIDRDERDEMVRIRTVYETDAPAEKSTPSIEKKQTP